MSNVENKNPQQLHRLVRILECFSQDRPELGVREAARLVDLSSSVTGRLMLAMKELGVLSQNPLTKMYSMGPRVLTWAGIYLSTSDIRIVAAPYLEELHRVTHETISLYILDGDERVCVERLESTQNIRFVAPRIGRHLPLHAGSAGKVMLAFLSEAARETILTKAPLAALTERTIIDPELMRTELAKIRREGYAVSFGEWILDACGVAAPIFDRNAEILAALTISGPTQRFQGDALLEFIAHAKRVAHYISTGMGYQSKIGGEYGNS